MAAHMRAPSLESNAYRFLYSLRGEFPVFDKKRQIHQVFYPTVGAASWKRVGMEFLGKLLFARNHRGPGDF